MEVSSAQRRILQELREGPRQAHQVASVLGVEPSSAYRHLIRLKADGLVAAEDVIDGPGRPKRYYRLTEGGQEAFPRDYAFLLKAVLQEIEAHGGRAELLLHLQNIANRLATPLAKEPDLDARLRALLDLYNQLGFEATLERAGPDLVLVQRNCPFLKTARDDPRAMCVCLDEGLMRAALPDADVVLQETLAQGGRLCRHLIRHDRADARSANAQAADPSRPSRA